jgi:hypothetical protein
MKCIYQIIFSVFLFLIFSLRIQAQKEDARFNHLDSNLSYQSAFKDIASKKIKIFGMGGISPHAYSMADSIFEAKYKVTYILFGCETLYGNKEMQEYNAEIGKYLDKTCGRSWRKELHPDVIGLKE